MAESDARERILLASRQEIAENGVRGLRIQQVAKRASVSLGLIYYHFTDRAGLLKATLVDVDRAVQERSSQLESMLPADQLVTGMLAAEFGDDRSTRDDSVVWNEIRAIAVFETDLQTALAESTQDWQARLVEPLGRLGIADAELLETATLLTSLVEGLSSRWLSDQLDTASAQRLVRAGAAAILDRAQAGLPPQD